MSGLLPSDADVTDADAEADSDANGDLRVLSLDDDEAEQLIGCLSSDTARETFAALQRDPSTASELADAVDTSLQNVRHHLDNLRSAGLVRVADTRYSVKGREMKVYAPTQDSLVVCVGSTEDKDSFLDGLGQYVGAGAALAVAAVAVQTLFGAGVADLGGPATTPRVADGVTGGAEPVLGLLPPGVAFLAGGLLVLGVLLTVRAYGSRVK
ncbi:helix-turn-helix domain-containing protein [Halogeometricum sp. CBA1124]|uniref:ArsR/SmtB family transcription factor n=1 Tax=Halogeometricum sp. CBA1124 TaxID=2668071 RepID=UPI00142CBBF3|nr:helix-turn-helix domain-containing protein [Halogeometricum sp. CBA1124]MUV56432.1 helix-turn-helix domain-containing protein [Halogeometricum sp. CBA1124]